MKAYFLLCEFESLAELIAALYEAALDPDGLDALLHLAHTALGTERWAQWLQHDLASVDRRFHPALIAAGLTCRTADDNAGTTATIAPARADEFQHHLCRALQLRARHLAAFPQNDALNALSFGMIICTSRSRIEFANVAARNLGRLGIDFISRNREQFITASLASEAQRLQMLIEAAARGITGNLMLSARETGNRLGVRASSLPGAPAAGCYALLALRRLGEPPAFDVHRLIELFRLSPAQAILAVGLYEGKSFDDIAAERGVKVTTLRTHFAEVLTRTGSRSLRDLVRLLGLLPPVA